MSTRCDPASRPAPGLPALADARARRADARRARRRQHGARAGAEARSALGNTLSSPHSHDAARRAMDAKLVGPAALAAGERRRGRARSRARAAAARLPRRPGSAVRLGAGRTPAAAPLGRRAAVEQPAPALACTLLCAVLGVGAAWCVERTDATRAAPVGRAARAAARDPRLRGRLRLGLARARPARLPGGGDDHDAVALPARAPAVAHRARERRRRPRGGRAQPRPRPVADLPPRHAAPDLRRPCSAAACS